ncbi:hypothetical protein KCP70_14970 [Salmonella enterica subsp. enterica]|nr:hypothetical protein KCP70_14970 [Salmonella enterica subsp. enterica]
MYYLAQAGLNRRRISHVIAVICLSHCIGRGHDRLFDYGSEIHEQLLDLLERYGQRGGGYRYQSEGRWFLELQNAEFCSTEIWWHGL